MVFAIHKAMSVREKILKMANRSKGAHVGSCLSVVDILTYLYFKELRIRPEDTLWEDRDYFLMSKGHGAMALYAVLAERGVIDEKLLKGYMQEDGTLPAHLDRFSVPGIEVSAGALGHGLSIAVGIAHGLKLRSKKNRVFVLMGDGECQEGSVWEAAMLAPKLKLSNLTVIVDLNDLQGYGRPSELVSFYPFAEKWKAFGWEAVEADGHNFDSLRSAFTRADRSSLPSVIIAKTVKGKGISFMEDELKWHYFIVTDEHLSAALMELKGA